MERMEFVNTKWMATVASIWIQSSLGSYSFGVYSSVLKSSQGYDQSTLDTISVFKDIGCNVGILAGLLYSSATTEQHGHPGRRKLGFFVGPWVVLFAGAIQSFLGYFLTWTCVVGLIHRPPVPVMCFLIWLASHSMTFYNTANLVSGVHNFRSYGGTILGILKGFLGLSGAIMIQFHQTFFKNDPSTFILMLALLPMSVALLLMVLVRNYDTSTKIDEKYLNAFSGLAVIIAVYITTTNILDTMFVFPSWVRIFTSTVLLFLLVSPLGIAITAQREDYECDHNLAEEDRDDYHELAGGEGSQAKNIASSNYIEFEQDTDLCQAMCSVDFWLLFLVILCGTGSGIGALNNIGQIGESLGYTSNEINSLVSLSSVWNFLGRFGSGYVSDFFLHRYGWARPVFMALTLSTMTIGHIVIASGFPKCLYLGLVLVGVSDGSQWSLMTAITPEIFGLRHMGTVFNTISIAAPVGSYIFSVRVIGYFYDMVAAEDGGTCYGTKCFRLSFIIMASVAFVGILFALALFFRTRRFYQQLVLKRLTLVSRSQDYDSSNLASSHH